MGCLVGLIANPGFGLRLNFFYPSLRLCRGMLSGERQFLQAGKMLLCFPVTGEAKPPALIQVPQAAADVAASGGGNLSVAVHPLQ